MKLKNDSIMERQMWLRGQANADGYFTLKNLASGKFLSAPTVDRIALEGTFSFIIRVYFVYNFALQYQILAIQRMTFWVMTRHM